VQGAARCWLLLQGAVTCWLLLPGSGCAPRVGGAWEFFWRLERDLFFRLRAPGLFTPPGYHTELVLLPEKE